MALIHEAVQEELIRRALKKQAGLGGFLAGLGNAAYKATTKGVVPATKWWGKKFVQAPMSTGLTTAVVGGTALSMPSELSAAYKKAKTISSGGVPTQG